MTDKNSNLSLNSKPSMGQDIGAKASRKLHAKRHNSQTAWFGLGMMGLIGWSVVVPTLLGAALGMWLDKHHTGSYSWTLMLLIAGLALGCVNAWHWMNKEHKEIQKEQEDHDE
jgi:ATP synthase protein I